MRNRPSARGLLGLLYLGGRRGRRGSPDAPGAERQVLTDRLAHDSRRDAVTGLANRAAFDDALPRMLARRRPDGHTAAVLVLDLDNLKQVNDTHGRHMGDRLLRLVADRLTTLVRGSDLVARLGGDEFAVLADDTDVRGALILAARITEELREPAEFGALLVTPGVSVGIYIPDGGSDAEQALIGADTAMYAAKSGGGGPQLFDPDRHRDVVQRYELELALRGAGERGELVLHYQPVLDLATKRTVGVEALLRWNHPTQGLLHPDAFLHIAELSDLVVELGRWVLVQGCADARLLTGDLPAGQSFLVAVNLSQRQLNDGALVGDVAAILQQTGLAPDRLALEVTEVALMQEPEAMVALLQELKKLGVQLVMDDFGSGYSSIAQLALMPLDVLKIDKTMVDDITSGEQAWVAASAVIRVARTLGKLTMAEGIEHAPQLAHLRRLGCDLGQGYLFARPMPVAEVAAFLARERSDVAERLDLSAEG